MPYDKEYISQLVKTLLIIQNGKCAICEKILDIKYRKSFHLDHCHKNKLYRGLLCQNCNVGLGYFDDNPELLMRAALYLLGKINIK